MDRMFTKYKKDFISSIRSTLDMLYNSKDLMDIRESKDPEGAKIDEMKYQEISKNISDLEHTLQRYQSGDELTANEQNIALAAMGTAVVHLEYLSRCYSEAAEKAKIIIANVKNGT